MIAPPVFVLFDVTGDALAVFVDRALAESTRDRWLAFGCEFAHPMTLVEYPSPPSEAPTEPNLPDLDATGEPTGNPLDV